MTIFPDFRVYLKREIVDGVREHVTPAITAVAALLIVLSAALMVAMEMLRRRSERLTGRQA